MSWQELQTIYNERGLVLVLGSGVSAGCGLPTWAELLQQLFDDLQTGLRVSDLETHLSLPAIASLIVERLGDHKKFVSKVRDILYQKMPYYPNGVDKRNHTAYVHYIEETNPTLHAIAALCAVRNPDSSTYSANPNIHAIVNFNLDGLLQAYVFARYQKRLLRTVERASAGSIDGKISTYHMHGFLRFDKHGDDLSKNAPDAVVLTEQDYFDFFNQPTSLFNYTFLYLLREYPCLFIGLSMRDDNIRRLLHYSREEKFKALQAEGERNSAKIAHKLTPHFAVLKKKQQQAINKAIEQTLHALGVQTLWIDDFSEIPPRLGELYGIESVWHKVF